MEKLKVALQLYSVRDEMHADPVGTFRAVKEMGYDFVEFAGGANGLSGEEIREMLDKAGLKCVSVHQSPDLYREDPEEAMRFVKALGAAYRVIPMGKEADLLENFEETVSLYRAICASSRENGVIQLYHNHWFEFQNTPEGVLFDRIFSAVGLDLLRPEIDVAWAHYGLVDPALLIRKYKGFVQVVHLKDFVCKNLPAVPLWKWAEENGRENFPASRKEAGFSYRPVGYGVQDFGAILSACASSGTEYVVVEQDSSKDRPPLEAAAMSRAYLKNEFGI